MSCFILSDNAIMTIAHTISSLSYAHQHGTFGICLPGTLQEELRRRKCCDMGYYLAGNVAEQLYNLNVSAFRDRYEGRHMENIRESFPLESYRVGISLTSLHDPSILPDDGLIRPQSWHYRFLSMLDCYLYQTDQDATIRDPLRLALFDLASHIRAFVSCNDPRYPRWTDF